MWRKGKPLTLLVGMKTSTATMEKSVEIPLKPGNRTAIWPSNPTPGHTHWGNHIWKRHIAALFIIDRTWKQPRCPSADKWIRKLWYIYTVEYYSAIKKNSFESVLMRWMKLEPIIQSEVSQKEKHQYSILMHIYGIWKDGNDNPICKTEKETQMYRTDFWTLWEKARVGWSEITELKYVFYQLWNRSPVQVWCMRQVLGPGALVWPRGIGWGGRWEEGSGWGTHVNPWLIHINVWQKPLQYCKVISLQLI